MNAEPHTHEPKLHQPYMNLWKRWAITYGDQTVTVSWWTRNRTDTDRFRRKVVAATKRAIEQHDLASQRAGHREHSRAAAEQQAAMVVSQWR